MSGDKLVKLIDSIMRPLRQSRQSSPEESSSTLFHEALAANSEAYRRFTTDQQAGEDWAAMQNARGRELRKCRAPVTKPGDSEEDWADRINQIGRELRKR